MVDMELYNCGSGIIEAFQNYKSLKTFNFKWEFTIVAADDFYILSTYHDSLEISSISW